jgi:hypothetical protein
MHFFAQSAHVCGWLAHVHAVLMPINLKVDAMMTHTQPHAQEHTLYCVLHAHTSAGSFLTCCSKALSPSPRHRVTPLAASRSWMGSTISGSKGGITCSSGNPTAAAAAGSLSASTISADKKESPTAATRQIRQWKQQLLQHQGCFHSV